MIQDLLKATFYSMVVFCVISYFSVVYSLLPRDISEKPVTNIGFPYKYYYQFWASGSDSPNCGWKKNAFIYDALITWSIVTLIYYVIRRVKSK